MSRHIHIVIVSTAALCLGTAAIVAAHGDETAVGRPAAFTASIQPGPELIPEDWEIVGAVARYRDGVWSAELEHTSDPRLDGDVTLTTNRDLHLGDFGLQLSNSAIRIETPAGVWEETPSLSVDFGDGRTTTRTSALVGAGGYDGWIAVAEITLDPETGSLDLAGVIFEGQVPQAPDTSAGAPDT